MRKLLFAVLTMVASIFSSACHAVDVVPADSMTMVVPATGEIPGGGKGWMQKNPVWDGKKISIAGAKGETLVLQFVIVRKPGEAIKGITVVPDLKGMEKVNTFRSWCIWGAPEIAVPLKTEKYPSFDIPSQVPVESKYYTDDKVLAWSVYVEFTIPRKTGSDTVSGTVKVAAESGLEGKSFSVDINVLDFEIPARATHIIEMNTYGDYAKYLPRTVDTFIELQKFMRDHRCTFIQVPYYQGGYFGAKWIAPKVDKNTGKVDWTEWDKNFGALFDGSAFDDGQPVSHFMLPLNYNWPLGFGTFKKDRAKYDKVNIEVRKEIAKHIKEKGWNKTIFQEFHNENPSNGAKLPWHLDEPRSEKDMAGHEIYSNYHKEGIKGFGGDVKFHYRIDISKWQRVKNGMNRLAPNIQDWIVSRDPNFLNVKTAPMFRKFADANKGMFFTYGEIDGFSVDRNFSQFDKFLQECWLLNADGFEQWMIDMWASKGDRGPMEYSRAAGMRDLIWPSKHFGLSIPLASLRLKSLRESSNLFDYASMAVEKGKATREEVTKLVSSMNMNNSDDHYKIKKALAEMISK